VIARALLLLALVAGLAAPAHARDKESEADARKAMSAYVDCLLNRSGYKLRKAIDIPVGDPSLTATLAKLATSSCLGDTSGDVELRMQPLVLRGAAFESLYRSKFGDDLESEDFSQLAPLEYPVATPETQNVDGDAASYLLMMAVGDCLVRADASASHDLVISEIASAGETDAIESLMPMLPVCIPAGRTLELSRSMLRGAIAEPLYRLSVQQSETGL
tara:strand:- start:338 stop:991 length:654 start_codon:yes stop_codon:yes gene_type:complete